jgi:hypothetical protein
MTKRKYIKTGEKAPESGLYRFSGRDTEIALSKGDIVPPNIGRHHQKVILTKRTKGGN